ncbi:MAG TPA: molybdopterin molybdenumtransferase MoeA [Devosia sp.]|nr:molybdopterin molybdenumtransferase MoeA [Devosia sp.]
MLNFDEALSRILEQVKTLGTETVELGGASGRVLAEPVFARTDQPPFDGSAMDGYAVRSRDIAPGAVLEQIGESQAGAGFSGTVGPGQCIRIFTGAPMPEGADAVVMQEVALVEGNKVAFEKTVLPGQNVRSLGQDFVRGTGLATPGTALNPARVAHIAAGNVPEVKVFKRPVIGLLATGDELKPPGSELEPGQIVGSNSFALSALFSPFASQVLQLDNASDDEEQLRALFQKALDGPANIIVSTGGASVGDHDLVLPVLKSLGVTVDFWKIAMRPGKPVMFGRFENKLFFALPGNPVSAYVTAITLVLPAIRAASGYSSPSNKTLRLPLASPLSTNGPRRHFMRCTIETLEGASAVHPILQTDSSHLTSLAAADGLLIVDENAQALQVGQVVEVILI